MFSLVANGFLLKSAPNRLCSPKPAAQNAGTSTSMTRMENQESCEDYGTSLGRNAFFQTRFQLYLGPGGNTQGSQKAVEGLALGSYTVGGITSSSKSIPLFQVELAQSDASK